jgi:diguanylate cyclase (GGDEF)-like protein
MHRFRLPFLLLVFLCLGWTAGDTRAQAVLSGAVEKIDLWPHVTVHSDPTRAVPLEQVLSMRERFTPPQGAYATLGWASEALWLRVPLVVGAGAEGEWILDFDYALLQRVDVFLLRDGKVVQQARLGNDQPYAQRPLFTRSHAAPLILASGGTSELLMRVDTKGARILPVSLSRLSAFQARALDEQFLQGALTALGLVLLLYSLAQWASLRENLYLKYALLVGASLVFSVHFFGIGEMYLWTDAGWAQRHLAGVTSLLAAAATGLFVEDALAGDMRPSLRRALRAISAFHVVCAIAHGLGWMDIRLVGVIMNTTGLAPALMGIPGALAKARRGDAVGGWFLAAWLGYFVSSAVLVGVVRGQVGVNFWTLHSFQFGATFDMLVFMRIAVLRSAARHHEAQRAAQERDTLHSLAHTDALTGLLNRRGLDDVLSHAVKRATPERLLAAFMLDLDGFKPVNDKFGHDVGDQLLRVIAQRLRASVRAGDGVARVGGDEFVVMAEGLTHEAQALDLGTKLVEAFRTPFDLGPHSLDVSATIGYALAPADASDATTLLKAADAAMYTGKQEGKDRLLRLA